MRVTRRLSLTEHRTEVGIELSVEERDGIRSFSPGIRIEPTLGLQNRYDITADENIGLICLPGLTLAIRPKVPMASVLFLISYGCDAVSWADEHPEFSHEPDLIEALAIMLARMVQHVTRRGLINGYQAEEESLRILRGRLLFDNQLRRHFGINIPFEVRHDVFTSDILENRLLLSALTSFESMSNWSDHTRSELHRAQRLFGAVSPVRFSPGAVPDVIFTSLNHHYRPAIGLATLILRNLSLDVGTGGTKGSAFLIDMNAAFERFVRRALRDALGVKKGEFPDRPAAAFFDEAGKILVRPDLCLLEQGRVIWVGDAKYKRLPSGAHLNTDIYQLFAYAVALNLSGGVLIYAADEGVSDAEHVVVHARRRLQIQSLDLSASRQQLRNRLAMIASGILVARK